MTAPYLPGLEPPVTRDYYAPVPRRATFAGGLTGEAHRVFSYLSGLSRGGDVPVARTNDQIAADLGLHPSTVRRILGELKSAHPPGVDHPYIGVVGQSHRRRILVLYRPRKGPTTDVDGARAGARKSMDAARASARPRSHKSNDGNRVAPTPLFNGIQEKYHVDVISSIPEKPSHADACARASPPPPPAVAPPPPAADLPEPRDRSAAAIMRRVQALQERLAAEEARQAVRAIEAGAAGPQTPETVAALELATPPAPRPAPAPAASPHVETPDLIRRLSRPGGSDLVDQVVARLCQRVDPEFEPLYRRRCREAAEGALDVGILIGAFRWCQGAPGRGVKKGPAFAAYVRERLDRAAEARPAVHRRE